MDVKRGPKLGDAASLWNFTASPGWTKDEANLLRLCLMKYGVSAWLQIQATGLLPGKTVGQLSGQAQRLLGQQSLAPFAGLKVDVDAVRRDNDAKQGLEVRRKNGLIVWCGPNPTREMKAAWQVEAKAKYGLNEEQLKAVEAELEKEVAARTASRGANDPSLQGEHDATIAAAGGLETADPRRLPRDVVVSTLLPMLRSRMLAVLKGLEERAVMAASASSSPSSSSLALLQELRALRAERERVAGDEARPPTEAAEAAPIASVATATAVVSLTANAATATTTTTQKQQKQQQPQKPPKKKKKEAGAEDEAQKAAAAPRSKPTPKPKPKPNPQSSALAQVRGADVEALAAMGFPRAKARRALAAVGAGAVDEAVAWLLAH